MPEPDHRRRIADRNVEAILDAAENLLGSHARASIAAVAIEAGVSRVTVYAHFATREDLLEAVVERAVKRSATALKLADLESGTTAEALDRMIKAGWGALDQNHAIAQAAADQLNPEALARAHAGGRSAVRALVDRGRADSTFRIDVPADWLVSSCFALMHNCGDEVRAGRLAAPDALPVLTASLRSLFLAPS